MNTNFASVKSNIIHAYNIQKLHHAILLYGQRGSGKFDFAKNLVMEILECKNDFHPDLMIVEKEEGKRDISVEKIRKISEFLNQTSAISKSKFIIINTANDLNKSSSNAILKMLEEPHPNNFFILIASSLQTILPTIRSRCNIIKMPEISKQKFMEEIINNPSISAANWQFLSEICDNSLSVAVNNGADLSHLYETFLFSASSKKISDDLIKKLSDKNFSFEIFQRIFEFFFSRLFKFSSNSLDEFFFNEKEVFTNICAKFSTRKIFAISDESLLRLNKAPLLYLDKKLCIINIFNKLIYG